jgi:transcription-repair coupling factor (superfamily II helicase)
MMPDFLFREQDALSATSVVERGLELPLSNTATVQQKVPFKKRLMFVVRSQVERREAICYRQGIDLAVTENRRVTGKSAERTTCGLAQRRREVQI